VRNALTVFCYIGWLAEIARPLAPAYKTRKPMIIKNYKGKIGTPKIDNIDKRI
jgi:hypothetical protein